MNLSIVILYWCSRYVWNKSTNLSTYDSSTATHKTHIDIQLYLRSALISQHCSQWPKNFLLKHCKIDTGFETSIYKGAAGCANINFHCKHDFWVTVKVYAGLECMKDFRYGAVERVWLFSVTWRCYMLSNLVWIENMVYIQKITRLLFGESILISERVRDHPSREKFTLESKL